MSGGHCQGFLDDYLMHALQASDSEGVILISSKFLWLTGAGLWLRVRIVARDSDHLAGSVCLSAWGWVQHFL